MSTLDSLEHEIAILERWLQIHKRNEKTIWYRDAKDHIQKLSKLFNQLKREKKKEKL